MYVWYIILSRALYNLYKGVSVKKRKVDAIYILEGKIRKQNKIQEKRNI